MHEDNFNKNAKKDAPQPVVTGYDIHIYFEPRQEDEFISQSELAAMQVASEIRKLFPDATKGMHRVGIVGPHASPNYEVDLTPEGFGKVISWLQLNNKGLSILVHPHTGDEVKDHFEFAIWLGKKVAFNDNFFAKLKQNNKKDLQP